MTIPQLRGLALRLRAFLRQSQHAISHKQSLDLIAALVDVKSWSEMHLWDGVAPCDLDETAVERLAQRLRKRVGVACVVSDLLLVLREPSSSFEIRLPEIWPAGPTPGVYVTSSRAAVEALVAKYEEATEGATFYAEATLNTEGAIQLGENGLWTAGMANVPSGTLIVVGPLKLAQNRWRECIDRVRQACVDAHDFGHRVVIWSKTPRPDEELCEDVGLLARSSPPPETYHRVLRGVVSEAGEPVERTPFARAWPSIKISPSIATGAIPSPARQLLMQAIGSRMSGLLIFGGAAVRGHWAADLVDDALALTDHAGPAARILSRMRSGSAQDRRVPAATKRLPLLPSVESAYERGYRRMVVDPYYVEAEVVKKYTSDVLFIAGTTGRDASETVLAVHEGWTALEEMQILTQFIGVLAVTRVPSQRGPQAVSDLFIGPPKLPPDLSEDMVVEEYVNDYRVLRWEDQVEDLLDRGEITVDDLRRVNLGAPIQIHVEGAMPPPVFVSQTKQ